MESGADGEVLSSLTCSYLSVVDPFSLPFELFKLLWDLNLCSELQCPLAMNKFHIK